MSILLRLVEFGGQGFSRVAQNSMIQQSTNENFVQRVSKGVCCFQFDELLWTYSET